MITVDSTDLLIAPPGIPDPRFRNTVLMLTHQQEQASFALCVNRPTAYTLDQILANSDYSRLEMPPFPIYWGGPVSTQSLWIMHSTDWVTEETVVISPEWAMTSNETMFYSLAEGDCPRHFRIVMGYCSWQGDQLSNELNGVRPWTPEHAWLVARNLGPEWLFEQSVEDLWASATTLCSHQAVDSWL